MRWGDYLKAWDRIKAEEDRLLEPSRREAKAAEAAGALPAAALEWPPGVEAKFKALQAERYRLNSTIAAEPDYFDRLRMWRVSVEGPCAPDEWTPCRPAPDEPMSGLLIPLDDQARGYAPPEWGAEPDLRQRAHVFTKALALPTAGSGGGMGGWDIQIEALTTAEAHRAIRAFRSHFAQEVESGALVLRLRSRLNDYSKLDLAGAA